MTPDSSPVPGVFETLGVLPLQPGSASVDLTDANWAGAIDLASDGTLAVGEWSGISLVPTGIAPCALPDGTITAQCSPCAELGIDPAQTTRWRPQRGSQPVEIAFTSPVPLASAELKVKDPTGVPLTVDPPATLTLVTSAPTIKYKLIWNGPWTQSDGSPFPSGNYEVAVAGVAQVGGRTLFSPPYGKISLVEVNLVDLRSPRQGQPPLGLSPNPAVASLTAQGQDPRQGRPGGGKRIFAEAASPTGSVRNRVPLTAVISPIIPADPAIPAERTAVAVHFRALDVDDPVSGMLPDLDLDAGDVHDNRGAPAEGTLSGCIVAGGVCTATVVAGEASPGKVEFQVSGQPGDNYRVLASTDKDWLLSRRALQPSTTGEVDAPPTSTSDMLTVWRTLHLEVDSMAPAPQSPVDPNRNFVRGEVIGIEANGDLTTVIRLAPAVTDPAVSLDDGSKNLSTGFGNGRFEKGKIFRHCLCKAMVSTSFSRILASRSPVR